MVTHKILGYSPFTVEFVDTHLGTTKVEKYAVALTKREIEAEYDYIVFPPNPVELAIQQGH